MLIVTFVVTALLAAFNLMAGLNKALSSGTKLEQSMGVSTRGEKTALYVAGWAEILGGIGAILPLALGHALDGWGWAIGVSVAAVIGLTLVQVLAVGFHSVRREFSSLPMNAILIAVGIASALLILATR